MALSINTKGVDSEFSLFELVEKLNMRNLFTNNRRSLVKISREIEDGVLENQVQARIFSGFQKLSFFLPHVARYTRLASIAESVWVFGVPDVSAPPIPNVQYVHLNLEDTLLYEWFLVVEGQNYFSALVAKDRSGFAIPSEKRMFDGIWTFDARLVNQLQTQLSHAIVIEPLLFEASNYDYDNQVARITNDLIADLEKRNQELEHQQKLRQDLSHMIVHDLRNPLSAVNGYLDLLERAIRFNKPADDLKEFVLRAQQSTSELGQLIDNILDINRFGAGEFPLELQPIMLLDLFEELMGQYAIISQQRRITLNMNLEDPALVIVADRQALKRIFTNLMSNAFRHTVKGSVTLEAMPCEDAQHVRLGVIDTGEGIPPDEIESVFEQYYQGRRRDHKRGSSGLGLAFCKLAVEAQKGKIWVESELDKGSAFYFCLPCRVEK